MDDADLKEMHEKPPSGKAGITDVKKFPFLGAANGPGQIVQHMDRPMDTALMAPNGGTWLCIGAIRRKTTGQISDLTHIIVAGGSQIVQAYTSDELAYFTLIRLA